MATFTTGDNNFSTAKFIVSPTAGQGTHTTIASAITAASSGDTIAIKQGTYTEDLTLKAGVILVGWTSNSVTIVGKLTAATAGTFWVQNVKCQTNADFCVDVSGSASTVLVFFQCLFVGTNSNIISFSSSNSSSVIGFRSCQFNLETTGITTFISTSTGTIRFGYCLLNNTGLSTTASTISAGTLVYYFSEVYQSTTTSGTSTIDCRHCAIITFNHNTIGLTHGGSGSSNISYSEFNTGTATALTVTSTLRLNNISVQSTNAVSISGAGTIIYDAIHFYGTTSSITTTTQTAVANIFATGKFNDGTAGAPSITFSGDIDTGIYRIGSNNMALVTAGASALIISAAGEVTKPLQPAFLATASSQTNVTGDSTAYTVVFDTEIFDQNSDFDGVSTFTAPITGRYQLNCTIGLTSLAAANSGNFTFVASNRSETMSGMVMGLIKTAANNFRMTGSMLMDMDAADTCIVSTTISGGTKTVGIEATFSTFSASLIC